MSGSSAPGTRLMSVSIMSGPSSGALLQKVREAKTKERFGVLTSQESQHDPPRIADQIREISVKGAIDHLLIACDPATPVMAYASLFLPQASINHSLSGVARLKTTVIAIKPSDLLGALVHRTAAANGSPCFLTEQVEFADNIVLEGTPDDPDFQLATAIALALNPRAQIFDLSQETLKRLLDNAEASFDFDSGLDGAGWRTLIDGRNPGCEHNNIIAFAYRARRPFHPERFWNLLQKDLLGIFRAKGFFWLATRMEMVGGLNLAGPEIHFESAGEWWAARDPHTRESEMPDRTRKEWEEPFGDRRQAIAFMALAIDPEVFKTQLAACLLTDSEMDAGPDTWHALTDPFPSWSGHSHEHECDHDHESGDHHCCHD